VPLVSFSFHVVNMPTGVSSWAISTLTPFGEKLLYTSSQMAANDVVSITNTPAVNCLLIQVHHKNNTASYQFFDWFTGRNGAKYVYDFSTTMTTEAISNPLVITTTLLPRGTIGVDCSQTLTASGGSGSYTWSKISGSLPAGLRLDESTGVISGRPTQAGTSNFTVQVTDSLKGKAAKVLSIKIYALPLSVTTTPPLPDGQVGVAYSQTLTASGGSGSYTWSKSGGSLLAGLRLTSTGVISGTPTRAGTANFNVRVKDSLGRVATQALSISIAPQKE
jgi:hypothetical protein